MAAVAVNAKKPAVEELVRKIEGGLVPDQDLRRLMKVELVKRLKWGYKPTHEQQLRQVLQLVHVLKKQKIATEVDTLVDEFYEVAPLSFLEMILGSRMKLSCCYFKDECTTLDEAEEATLELYCERAQIRDGQSVLDLGCGHGSLTLHVAQKYKNCNVTAVTNSKSQKEFVAEQCKKLKLSNVEVVLADVATLEMDARFDRIFAIELFEHMKNYELLLEKISEWMAKDGLLFVEHMCHKVFAYECETLDEDDWFSEYIYPSGTMIMPSASFLLYFQDDVSVVDRWVVNGKHYSRMCEEVLKRIDSNLESVKQIMESFSGSKEGGEKLTNYWRGFSMFISEFFGYNNGEEWMISHVLLKKK